MTFELVGADGATFVLRDGEKCFYADEDAVALEHIRVLDELTRTVHLSETDALTGLPNRRAWDSVLGPTLHPGAGPVCVALIDLDHFKTFNDRHGHQAGDELLQRAAQSWRSVLRESDVLARHGGEEFAAAFENCSVERAQRIAERIRRATPVGATASIGLAHGDRSEKPEALIARADKALYRGQAGRPRSRRRRRLTARPAADRV